MRCFVSINIPREVAKEIRGIQGALPDFYGKKTELENLHLTLKFLGEISEEKVKEVKNKLEEINLKDFESEIKYLGFFDNQKYGVIWVYLSNCDKLQKVVDEKLKDLFEPERRFMSHLTIARVKNIVDKKRFLKELKELRTQMVKFDVNKFYLMKSELTSNGSRYEVLEGYKLV